jgi:chromate reductase
MMKKIFAIVGSASRHSANLQLVQYLSNKYAADFQWIIFDRLSSLPHFDPELSVEDPPAVVEAFRKSVEDADTVLICTPEYVFSVPSGLKNALEWCVSTTIFANKSTAIITASAHGEKGHEELKMIMRTLDADVREEYALLVQGIKGKVDAGGNIKDEKLRKELDELIKRMGGNSSGA